MRFILTCKEMLEHYKPCLVSYCKILRLGYQYTYACHVQGTCEALQCKVMINSV